MLSHEELKLAIKSDFTEKVIPTNAKRVIVTIPQNVIGDDVTYIDWRGIRCHDNGFLFNNPTDKRTQFLRAQNGIIIGYEGECPEGPNGEMILRSEAVNKYLNLHPNALANKANIKKTLRYFQTHIFKHGKDVTQWDNDAIVDMWSSDTDWLVVNFDEKDIFDDSGNIKRVISATKKTAILDAIYFGPNIKIEGIGTTSPNGSWALNQKGKFNLVESNVFNSVYKRLSKRKVKIIDKKLISRYK